MNGILRVFVAPLCQ